MVAAYQGSDVFDHDGGPGNLPYSLQPASLPGIALDDFFFFQLTHDPTDEGDAPTYAVTPAEATQLIAPSAAPVGYCGSSVWWARYTGGTPTWTWQTTAGYEQNDSGGSLQYLWLRGVHTTDPFCSSVGIKPFSGASSTNHDAPSVTTDEENALIVSGFNTTSGSPTITIPAGGWTIRTNSTVRDGCMATKNAIQVAPGPTGTVRWNRSGSARGQAWQIGVRPAPSIVIPSIVREVMGALT
jgi:hypothetical protein